MVEVHVAEPTSFDQFDLVVHTFRKAVAPTFLEVVQDGIEPVAQSGQEALKDFDTEVVNGVDPIFQKMPGFFPAGGGFEDGAELLFELMAGGEFR